ncbi:MAG: hypothetical protein ACTSXX_08585 [Candidatus Baldrarchaeia archaeon]
MEDEEKILEMWKKELGISFEKKERKVEDIFRKVKVKVSLDFELEKIEELKRELEDEKLTEYRERFGERYGMMLYRLEQIRDALEEIKKLRENSLYVWVTIGRRSGNTIGIVQNPEDMYGVIVLFKHEPPRSLLHDFVYVTKYDIRLSLQKKKYVKAFEYYPTKFLNRLILEFSSKIRNRYERWKSEFYKDLLRKAREMMDPVPIPEGVQIRIGNHYGEVLVVFHKTIIYFDLWGEPAPEFFDRDENSYMYERTRPVRYDEAVEYIISKFNYYAGDEPENIKKYAELAKKYIDALNEALAYAKLCVLSPEKVEEIKNQL